ncbi:hypothetical protein [Streptomyces sp. LaPpAH-108]|uniref:hypothetical protein n=1 Tax=Streptomyces sp. LaPpAH-108 TaxID=1155714 RepID=UPI00035E0FB6|nr:hypothetical protein [Streptomyces sp. LaPpAH-108]
MLATVTLLTGCAQSVDPIERLGKKAAEGVHRPVVRADRAYRHWGLPAPLATAPHHAATTRTTPLPPVVDRVPTTDKVVFLTYDDGAGQDPRLATLIRELRLPVTVFATAPQPALHKAGATVERRAPRHGTLPGLPYPRQHTALCTHPTPHLLRPRQRAYDHTTLRAAAHCGITALVLWRATVTSTGVAYTRGTHTLLPGDIVRVGPARGSATALGERTARLLRRVQERGLTVGHLEDYL